MRATDRIEGGIDASAALAARGEPAHGRNEVAGAIVDRGCAEALDHREICGRAGANRLEAEVARQIEQRSADRARGANDEDRGTPRQVAAAGEHLEGGEIGERDAHRFGGIDTIGDRNEETRRADRILSVAADDAKIGDQLALAWFGYTGAGLLDDTHEVVAGRERQRALEVRVASAPNEGIGKAGAGGEHLDTDLAGAGIGDGLLFRQFQDLWAAEPGDTNVLP